MTRLLSESSSKNPWESKNQKEPELNKYHETLHDSGTEFMECWDGTQKFIQTNVAQFFGSGISPTYREKEVNTSTATCVDSLLLGFREGNEWGISLNEINPEYRSDMFVDRNLLTWNNSQSDHSPQYKTSCNIFKDDVLDEFCNGFDSDELSKFRIRKRSYELPTICYNRFSDNFTRKNYLEYKNETAGCNSDTTAADVWHPVPFERFSSSSLGDPRDSDKLDSCHLRFLEDKSDGFDCKPDTRAIDICRPVLLEGSKSSAIRNSRVSSEIDGFELRSEHIPLLLPWRTSDENMKASTHLTDMDHELYPSPSWSEDTTLGMHPSTFLSSSMLQDHHTKRRHWLQPKDRFARSNNDPLTLLYGPDFTGSHFCVISEDHNHYRGNFKGKEVISAAGALLISQDFDSELSWKSGSLSHGMEHYEKQYDIPTDDVCLKVPQSEEEWSWMNVENPAPREVSFPLQLHRIKWLDTAVETKYNGFQIATSDSL